MSEINWDDIEIDGASAFIRRVAQDSLYDALALAGECQMRGGCWRRSRCFRRQDAPLSAALEQAENRIAYCRAVLSIPECMIDQQRLEW